MPHQVEPPACQLPAGSGVGIGEPHRWNEVSARQFGKHARVDAVRLAGKRSDTLHLLGVSDLDVPPGELQGVVNEAGAVHRLNNCHHRLSSSLQVAHQVGQAVGVRRPRTLFEHPPSLVHHADIQLLPRQVHSNVQHVLGPPSVSGSDENPRSHRGRPRFMAFSCCRGDAPGGHGRAQLFEQIRCPIPVIGGLEDDLGFVSGLGHGLGEFEGSARNATQPSISPSADMR